MSITGDKFINVLVDSLSVEELENLLKQKRNVVKPEKVTEKRKWIEFYKQQLTNKGVLNPPKN
jgi:hypothetical protein